MGKASSRSTAGNLARHRFARSKPGLPARIAATDTSSSITVLLERILIRNSGVNSDSLGQPPCPSSRMTDREPSTAVSAGVLLLHELRYQRNTGRRTFGRNVDLHLARRIRQRAQQQVASLYGWQYRLHLIQQSVQASLAGDVEGRQGREKAF